MANIPSENIKVFPSVTRNDEKDRNARLNSEANIISLTNRLTGSQSYIINGLDLSEDGNEISAGRCCIYGYYFDINSPISVHPSNKYCYLHLQVTKKNTTDNIEFLQLNGDNSSNYYTSLTIDFETNEKTNNEIWVEDLSNTNWLINNTPALPSVTQTYNINFSTDGINNCTELQLYSDAIVYQNIVAYDGSWKGRIVDGVNLYRIISITGGEDKENTDLRKWFLNNGSLTSAAEGKLDYYLLVATKDDNTNDWVNENDSRIIKNSPFIIDDGDIS